LYVTISHNVGNPNEARIKRSKNEFRQLVCTVAEEIGYNCPPVAFCDKGPPGCCNTLGNRVANITFNIEVLNGGYTEEEIIQIIKHELAHAIANERHHDECAHDDRWKQVCEEIACDPSETLPLCKAYFSVEFLNDEKKQYKYYLLCDKCSKVQLETDSCDVIALLVMSAANVPYPFTFGNLGLKSSCCESKYRLNASAKGLLSDLEERKELSNIQERLRQLLNEN
jgi:SprT-like family.